MNQETKIRLVAFVVAALVALTGLAIKPAHAYAAYNPPTDHRGAVLTGELLLNPIESVTPHGFNPPTKP